MPKSNNSLLRVLFVVHWFDIMGGAVTRTTNLIKNLSKYNIDVSVLTTHLSKDVHASLIHSNLRKIYVRENVPPRKIPAGLDIFSISSMVVACLKYLKKHECDLIYVRPNPEDMLACSIVSILRRKPLILELHHHLGTYVIHRFLRSFLRMIEKLMVILSNKVVVNSWTFYRELKLMYGNNLGKKVYVIPNSVDFDAFLFRVDQPLDSTESSEKKIGFIGSLKSDEDLLCLAKAAKMLLRSHQNAVFVVIGQDDGLKRLLENEIERLELKDKFILIDERPSREIPGILKTFSVFVAPRVSNERTRYAMPIKILEAMASGVPVVATSLPPIEELADDAAVLVPPSNHVSLAKGILRLLEDSDFRNELIKKGLRRAENFDSAKIAGYFAKVLTT